MLRRLAVFAVFSGVAGLVARELAPDINRYLRIRRM
jgi:hypothetical protein